MSVVISCGLASSGMNAGALGFGSGFVVEDILVIATNMSVAMTPFVIEDK